MINRADHVRKTHSTRQQSQGFTALEMLIMIAIVGILASIALPAYQQNVVQGTRSVAVSGLMDLANRQQAFFLNNKTFTDDLQNLGFPAALIFELGGLSAIALNDSQTPVASNDAERVYVLRIDSGDTNAFAVSAVPQLGQASDTECATFSLNNMNAKTESGTGAPNDCW